MKTIIEIENLKCNGCASTIKKGLLKIDKVTNVEVDLNNSTVTITFNDNNNPGIKFRKKLSALGYPEKGNNSTFSVAKSFVSCAVGRVS